MRQLNNFMKGSSMKTLNATGGDGPKKPTKEAPLKETAPTPKKTKK
jgi:hypothetical protein